MDPKAIAEAFKAEHPDAWNAVYESGKAEGTQQGAAEEKSRLTALAGKDLFSADAYIAAFGDKGARAFLEKKPYATLVTEQVDGMKAEHATAIGERDAKITDLEQRLAAAPKGNTAAAFSAEPKPGEAAKPAKSADGTLTYSNGAKVGEGNARERVAAAIKLPGSN